ncbi:winged helix-turn-helix transcriptional regulator [Gordonia polyisoprenivorans]|uniref:winged helix-turn-helix transcriptional regulator n=1 Tax=Gordonia polyisoprenivorans TaxID=84595 RepID=UPI001F0ACFEE|nr:helix-turn-helix domain-containing protein [Gordonia polyisoprenivorans]WCB38577.1 helix-turn-helix domain-containing protein [Gordonia polyisoprenivorans]
MKVTTGTDVESNPEVLAAHKIAREVFAAVSTKWGLRTLEYLDGPPKRFADVCRSVGPVSHKVMTQTLRTLEHSGLVARRDHGGASPHVDYSLTPAGSELLALLHNMCAWSRAHLDELIESGATHTSLDG